MLSIVHELLVSSLIRISLAPRFKSLKKRFRERKGGYSRMHQVPDDEFDRIPQRRAIGLVHVSKLMQLAEACSALMRRICETDVNSLTEVKVPESDFGCNELLLDSFALFDMTCFPSKVAFYEKKSGPGYKLVQRYYRQDPEVKKALICMSENEPELRDIVNSQKDESGRISQINIGFYMLSKLSKASVDAE
ncbi:hypothetical protein RF11_08512 [Thelohanellus kitauei]|uniref:Uncharacterized protein n=1 Tax=Thelohanellus kitauei TaxID=669202 RepID=A0A0C2N9U4_THEKT|nr:hypothetical protein RF11_04470 [Thelohanellus kitauei]KII71996.1 hypothetical protein RF11_08512 [Thelohanellus kitauei]